MKTSLDNLNSHLFEAIEMLKNNNDPTADAKDRIDIDTAKVIADLAKNVVETYKVKAQLISTIAKADNPESAKSLMLGLGFSDDK